MAEAPGCRAEPDGCMSGVTASLRASAVFLGFVVIGFVRTINTSTLRARRSSPRRVSKAFQYLANEDPGRVDQRSCVSHTYTKNAEPPRGSSFSSTTWNNTSPRRQRRRNYCTIVTPHFESFAPLRACPGRIIAQSTFQFDGYLFFYYFTASLELFETV